MKKQTVLVLLLLLCFACSKDDAFDDNYEKPCFGYAFLGGTVYNAETGNPIPSLVVRSDTTDNKGLFVSKIAVKYCDGAYLSPGGHRFRLDNYPFYLDTIISGFSIGDTVHADLYLQRLGYLQVRMKDTNLDEGLRCLEISPGYSKGDLGTAFCTTLLEPRDEVRSKEVFPNQKVRAFWYIVPYPFATNGFSLPLENADSTQFVERKDTTFLVKPGDTVFLDIWY